MIPLAIISDDGWELGAITVDSGGATTGIVVVAGGSLPVGINMSVGVTILSSSANMRRNPYVPVSSLGLVSFGLVSFGCVAVGCKRARRVGCSAVIHTTGAVAL